MTEAWLAALSRPGAVERLAELLAHAVPSRAVLALEVQWGSGPPAEGRQSWLARVAPYASHLPARWLDMLEQRAA